MAWHVLGNCSPAELQSQPRRPHFQTASAYGVFAALLSQGQTGTAQLEGQSGVRQQDKKLGLTKAR